MIARPAIAPPQDYRGSKITAHALPPDVLIRIDGNDLGIYLSTQAGYSAAMRHIDEKEKQA